MADFPKKQQQCLIPKYLLDYLGEVNELHPDPSDLGGGDNIEAGTGIVITGDDTKTISVDDETVAMVANLDQVAFSGSYNDLSNKPDLSVYELKEDAFSGDYEDLTNKPDLSVYELKSEAFSGNYNDLTNKPDLSIYAETADLGDCAYLDENELSIAYSQITGTPTIPTKTSELTNDSNFIPSDSANRKIYTNYYVAPFGNTWSRANYESNCIGFENQDGYSALYFPTNKTDTIATINDIPTNVSDLTNDAGYITGVTWNDVTGKPTFATVATTGSYNDLTNKPIIPTVGNGTITIKKNNTTVDTFTTNQSSNKSINITVPTDTSDLTNGAGFITAAQVPAGWEVVDVYQTQGSTPVSAADLAKLAGDNVCIRYNLDAIGQGYYELYYKKGDPTLYGGDYCFDSFNFGYNIITTYIGFNEIRVNATTGVWSTAIDNRAYAGHKIESGSGLVEGSNVTSYGKTLSVDTSVVALKNELFSGNYNDLTNKPTIPDAVSGTNDGTNWTSLTIGNDTYAIGGGGSAPTNMVTTNTNQEITGIKGFTGDKQIRFFDDASDVYKMGFTCYHSAYSTNPSNQYENGYLEAKYSDVDLSYSPSIVLGMFNNTNISKTRYLGFKYYSNNSGTTNQCKLVVPTNRTDATVRYMPVSINGQFADNKGEINLAIPDVSNYYTKTEVDGLIPTTASSTSTVTPTTTTLVFTYTDNTTETVTLMTGASVSTTTTLS